MEPNFPERVYLIVEDIPEGKVMSYGQVAAKLGNPHLARNVGYALSNLKTNERKIPWWRVINSKGYLSINKSEGHEKDIQKALLEDEGVEFIDEYTVDKRFFAD